MAEIDRAKNTYEREPSWLVFLFVSQVHLIRAVWKMAKVQRKQRTCKLRGNMFKLTTTVTAVHKCIYLGSQWSSLVWDRKVNRWKLYFLKQAPFWYVTGEGEAWAEHGAQREGIDSQDQLVVLIVETSKLYRPSEPTSTLLVRASFVLRDFCYSRQGLPFNSRLLQISSMTYMSYLNTSITLVW